MADITLPPLDITTSTPTAPALTDLTTAALEGTGAFDVLMQTVKLHLTEEFDNNRIVGKEYATVYLGAMTAVMQQAVAYLLNTSQVEQLNAQIGLIRQQIVTELSKTDDVIPEDLGFNDTTDILGLAAAEKSQVVANIEKIEADTANQTLQTTSAIEVNDAQIAKMVTDAEDQRIKVLSDEDVNDAQITKMGADTADQTLNTIASTALQNKQIDKLTADITDQDRKVDSEIAVGTAQISKLGGEVLLLGQKTISELAQTCDTLPVQSPAVTNVNPWLNDDANVQGNIGKQSSLYEAQTDGFTRDAEQKLAKILVDSWSVRMGAGEEPLAANAGLGELDIRAILNIARVGIGGVAATESDE